MRQTILAAVLGTTFWADGAGAQTLESKILVQTRVQLETTLWTLDEEKVDADGDRDFYADYVDPAADISIGVSEARMANPGEAPASVAGRFVQGLKKIAKTFTERPCPDDYRPPQGWACVAYDMAMTQPRADTHSIVHVTTCDGFKVIKRLRIGFGASEKARGDAARAFRSIVLRRSR